MVTRIACILTIAAALAAPAALGIDWPVKLNFQLGFKINVVPAPDDASRALGLVVTTDSVRTEKDHYLVATGTIANFSGVPCEGVDMRFAVTSYVGTGASFGVAAVEPNVIPPGGVARFSAHISLDSPRPRNAMYTVTAQSPVVAPQPYLMP